MPPYSVKGGGGRGEGEGSSPSQGYPQGGAGSKKSSKGNREEMEEREKMKNEISKMLSSIDEWNLRVFGVELKLMHHQVWSQTRSSFISIFRKI